MQVINISKCLWNVLSLCPIKTLLSSHTLCHFIFLKSKSENIVFILANLISCIVSSRELSVSSHPEKYRFTAHLDECSVKTQHSSLGCVEFAALCFIKPIVSIGCESQEPERQHGRSKRQRICVVTESQQVIIEQEAVCNWPVFGAVCCAEAGAERYWWKFLHHIRRCFFALEPRLLPRASALITGKEPPPWTLRSVFVCVYERAGCGVSCFSGAQSPPILSPCLSSFNTSTALIHTPQQVIIWGVRPCLKTQSKHCSQSQNLRFYVWILSLTNQKYYKLTLSSLIMTI